MNATQAYALSKKYTEESLIGIGAVKGAPCKVKSVVKTDGRAVVTLEWKDDLGATHTSELYVNDGISIWLSGRQYAKNDVVINDSQLYICKTPNSDTTFDGKKWDVVIGGSGGDATLSKELTVVKAVGGISVGTTYATGTALEKIFRDMLAPVLYPTLTNPSATITATGAKLLETGSTLNTTFTVIFDRGSISPAYGTSGKRSGNATGYSLNGGAVQAGNTFNATITSAQLNYQAAVNYAAGEQPKDSAGNNYSTPLPAGSVNSNIITYEFVDAIYANTLSADVMTKQDLVSRGDGSVQFDLPATTVANPEQIDIPGSWTVSKIEVLNTLSGQWEDATSQFTATTTSHNDAAGNPVSYNRYTCNLGMALGARSIKVLWS